MVIRIEYTKRHCINFGFSLVLFPRGANLGGLFEIFLLFLMQAFIAKTHLLELVLLYPIGFGILFHFQWL